jgi:hypothetical protein
VTPFFLCFSLLILIGGLTFYAADAQAPAHEYVPPQADDVVDDATHQKNKVGQKRKTTDHSNLPIDGDQRLAVEAVQAARTDPQAELVGMQAKAKRSLGTARTRQKTVTKRQKKLRELQTTQAPAAAPANPRRARSQAAPANPRRATSQAVPAEKARNPPAANSLRAGAGVGERVTSDVTAPSAGGWALSSNDALLFAEFRAAALKLSSESLRKLQLAFHRRLTFDVSADQVFHDFVLPVLTFFFFLFFVFCFFGSVVQGETFTRASDKPAAGIAMSERDFLERFAGFTEPHQGGHMMILHTLAQVETAIGRHFTTSKAMLKGDGPDQIKLINSVAPQGMRCVTPALFWELHVVFA